MDHVPSPLLDSRDMKMKNNLCPEDADSTQLPFPIPPEELPSPTMSLLSKIEK